MAVIHSDSAYERSLLKNNARVREENLNLQKKIEYLESRLKQEQSARYNTYHMLNQLTIFLEEKGLDDEFTAWQVAQKLEAANG